MPYVNSCKNHLCAFLFFLIFSPLFYPSHLLFTVTDHSFTFWNIAGILILLFTLCFWAPGPWKSKSQGCVAGGQVLLVQIHSFAFECSHLRTNAFIHRNKRILSMCTICANKNWIHETTQKSQGEIRSPAIFTLVLCLQSDNICLKRTKIQFTSTVDF